MAPQNSTLINENGDCTVELSECFQPISPLILLDDDDGKMENLSNCEGATTSTPTTVYDGRGSKKWNKKSIYCRAINYKTQEEPEQDSDEIPIWICGEPRYISGITEMTTCQDLIQALIDDEISTTAPNVAASRDVNDYMITERWRDVEQALPADTRILPIWNAWDLARDEVKFRLKINKNATTSSSKSHYYEQDKHNELHANNNSKREKLHFLMKILKKLLKQRQTIDLKLIESKKCNFNESFETTINNIFRATHTSTLQENFQAKPKSSTTKSIFQTIKNLTNNQIGTSDGIDVVVVDDDDDELLLVIENNYDDGDSGVHVEGRTMHHKQYEKDTKATTQIIHTNNMNYSSFPLHNNPQDHPHHHNQQYKHNTNNPNFNNDDEKLLISCKLSNSNLSINSQKNSNNNKSYLFQNDDLQNDDDINGIFETRALTTKRKVSTTVFSNDLQQKHKYNRSNRQSQREIATTAVTTTTTNNINHLRDVPKITRFEVIQNEIFMKIHDIRLLLEQEHILTDMLEHKCNQYKTQNEKYMMKLGSDFCIDRVQENLEIYTREIIQNEQELLNVKIEILDKTKKLEHLKRVRDLEMPKQLRDRVKGIVPRELIYDEDDGEYVDSLTGTFDKNEESVIL